MESSRPVFTVGDLRARGLTSGDIRRGVRRGEWQRVQQGVYIEGGAPPTALERALALVRVTGGVAAGRLAAALHGLDGVGFGVEVVVPAGRSGSRHGVRRRQIPAARVTVVEGVRCTDGTQTMVDLAGKLDDARWEQALESALRKGLTTVESLGPGVGQTRAGSERIARVLAARPPNAPPTESLLETLMVQLARTVPDLPPPIRQLEVYTDGRFVARVDLAWPELGVFVELDGQHHQGQPLYDASRETAIAAATGWICGRFTWTDVYRHPIPTARRLGQLVEQARLRPLRSTGTGRR